MPRPAENGAQSASRFEVGFQLDSRLLPCSFRRPKRAVTVPFAAFASCIRAVGQIRSAGRRSAREHNSILMRIDRQSQRRLQAVAPSLLRLRRSLSFLACFASSALIAIGLPYAQIATIICICLAASCPIRHRDRSADLHVLTLPLRLRTTKSALLFTS